MCLLATTISSATPWDPPHLPGSKPSTESHTVTYYSCMHICKGVWQNISRAANFLQQPLGILNIHQKVSCQSYVVVFKQHFMQTCQKKLAQHCARAAALLSLCLAIRLIIHTATIAAGEYHCFGSTLAAASLVLNYADQYLSPASCCNTSCCSLDSRWN